MRNWCRTRFCLPHEAGQAGPHLPASQMGKAPTHCSPGCFDREGRECGPGDRKVQLPDTKVCQTRACPPDRKAGPWSYSVLPSCCATPSNALAFLGLCRRRGAGGFVCGMAWTGSSRLQRSLHGPSYTTPSDVPLHSRYYTQDTSTGMPCILHAWSHTFTLSDKHHAHNLTSVHTHHRSHLTVLLFHN